MTAGRPSDYRDTYPEQAFKLALLGATDSELADFFEVNQDTIYEWQKRHPEFSESIRDGKLKADTEVAKKLYDKAIGAEWTEQRVFKLKDQTESGVFTERLEVIDVKCAAAPDTQAISLWLRNRQGGKWRDKIDHEHVGKDGGAIEVKDVTAVEFARRAAFLFAQAEKELNKES